MTKPKQADDEIHEDQLLNFLVNTLTGAFSLDIGENADLDAEDIFEVLVGACADGTSISELCDVSEDAPPATNILYHLRTKFDFDTVELIGNSLLQRDVLELLPEQVEVVIDLHLRPYYGDEDETDGLYHSEAKDGTTAFHAYATLYARVRSKRYTLAVRRLTDGDTASSVLAELLGLLEQFDIDIKAVYLDRGFYDGKCSVDRRFRLAILPVSSGELDALLRYGAFTTTREEVSRDCQRTRGESRLACRRRRRRRRRAR